MNKRVFYLMIMTSCLLFAGQANGQTPKFFQKHKKMLIGTPFRNSTQQPDEYPVFPLLSGAIMNNPSSEQVARPTTIFREEANTKKKYECEYDDYGHITLLKCYIHADLNDKEDNYVYRDAFVNEYHLLPNGEFVKTKEEYVSEHESGYKKTSAYDSKGMQLYNQIEFWNAENRNWRIAFKIEAVLNENGVRTAIRSYNPNTEQMEPDNSYRFDSKGRVIHYEREMEDGEREIATYTWDNNDRISECTNSWISDDINLTATYTNIQTVRNEKYFNQYSLLPISFGDSDYNSGFTTWGWGIFAAEDYTLHRIFYNADAVININGEELRAQLRTSVNADQTQITETITSGTQTIQSTFFLPDENGSYHIKHNYADGGKYENSATYNDHGELIRKYLSDIYTEEESGEERKFEQEYIYEREYDSQNRPIKTIFSESYNSLSLSKRYEETYTTWTTIYTGIEKTSQAIISIYPNPASDHIVIENAPAGTTIAINDISGRTLHKQILTRNKETITVASLPQGIYPVILQTENQKIINKIVKK